MLKKMVLPKLCLASLFIGIISAFNVLDVANVVKVIHGAQVLKIFPEKVVSNIPEKLSFLYSKLDRNNDKITESYTFPDEYKTTLYKDQDQKTTLVNMFPTVETKTASLQFHDVGYQILETSTTLIYEMLNSTVEYQTTPQLNSTLLFPITAPIQKIDYATVAYQHETLVYPTQVNITYLTSTKMMNYTVVDKIDNNIPLL